MAKIKLYGELAEQFNPEYNLDVNSPKEAVRALCLMVPNFKKVFSEGNYFLYVENNELIPVDENNYAFNAKGDILIVPEIVGAKKGLGKVLMGIALIGLTFIPGANVAVLGALSAATPLGGAALMTAQGLVMAAVTNLGIAMVLGGAAMMLAPKVNNNSEAAEKQQSYIFDGSDINIQNGACVPVIYGKVLAAGYPISIEVTDTQTAPVNADTTYNNYTGGWTGWWHQTYEV